MGPWDPNWRPDPTGRRLEAMHAARRGALLSALIFGSLVIVAVAVGLTAEGTPTGIEVSVGFLVACLSLPGLALLGAGLTSAARSTTGSAISGGVAIGVGVPVAAVTSAIIGVFVAGSILGGFETGTELAGVVLRLGRDRRRADLAVDRARRRGLGGARPSVDAAAARCSVDA